MNIRIFIFTTCVLLMAGLTLNSQQPAAKSPGTQNAPPPAGGAQDSRAPTGQKTPRRVPGAGEGYPTYDAAAVERGQKVFQANCQFCHGATAKGGEGGPNLLRSVLVLHDDEGSQIGPVIHNGRPDKGMPKFPLTDEQIADISTFLHQKVKDAALRDTYQVLNIVTGDAKKGEAFFNGAGACSGCHSVSGDLAHIAARMEPVELQQKIVMPRAGNGRRSGGGPGNPKQQRRVTVVLASGETVEGALLHIDDFNVTLLDGKGEYCSLARNGDVPKVTVQDPLQGHTDLLTKYTDADIHNLTAYLVTLK